eukprot:TRINITY_DN12069_c0_g1_i1.p1 TRINITY_DN12069_c0_g1~~TRINITY_DN12069_c0_g1_i1.p1  ORF type:complete len:841 (-),score=108.64 TRINITY_DN12069_c0_g1_i1:494-2650(-)
MASQGLEERARLIEEAWETSAIARVYLVDDWMKAVPRSRQWKLSVVDREDVKVVAGKSTSSTSAVAEGYWDAQSRQLGYMKANPEITLGGERYKWVILADDDTFVNVELLVTFAARHDPLVPALFTYVLSDAHVLGYDYPCGGAGMLLSAAAYELVAPHLLTPECPMLNFNDLTLGFCVHKHGIPLVHSHNMRCSPDLNRAMRTGDNLMDIHRGVAVHRLPAFRSFSEIVGVLSQMEGQLPVLLERECILAARTLVGSVDSRRFFWTNEAFQDAVTACRRGTPGLTQLSPLHLDFLFFGRGVPVARYHQDRKTTRVAEPHERASRWPEWMEQLRHLDDCVGRGDTWRAKWSDAIPRVSRVQVKTSDLAEMALAANTTTEALAESFEAMEAASPRGSWLDELRFMVNRMAAGKDTNSRMERENPRVVDDKSPSPAPQSRRLPPPGHRWLFLSFMPSTTFVNVFESLEVIRGLSSLYRGGGRGESGAFYAEDVRGQVDLGALEPPPLGLAYENFDLNVEQDAGVWLNGVAVDRLLRCPTMHHPIQLDPVGHANDWDTERERLALMWHNALAVDIFRLLRFCGVLMLHTPQMVPHGLSYLPYSTFRRVHAPSVASAISIGNVVSREQMYAMAELVRQRACRQRKGNSACIKGTTTSCPSSAKSERRWRPPFRMRAVGCQDGLNLTEQEWRLPGARFLGNALVAFRSEHFLPDAQAVDNVRS